MFFCPCCDRSFKEEDHILQHFRAKHYFPCKYCDDWYQTYEGMTNHHFAVHLTVECEFCDRRFKEIQHMEQHCDAVHYFPCNYCDYYFPTKEDRDDHDREEHLIIECPYCDKLFREEEHMGQHCDAVHYFPCNYCDYYYPTKEDRDDHDREEHLIIECPYCDKLFREVEHMEQHKHAKHAERDYFACKRCDSQFSDPYLRQKHQRYYCF